MNETTDITKPVKPKPPAIEVTEPKKPDGAKTILVKNLTFHHAHANLDARMSIAAESAPNKGKVLIEFVPSLRHHRIEIHKPNAAPRVLFVHEGNVSSWEPLA
jgi:hypothetical protein